MAPQNIEWILVVLLCCGKCTYITLRVYFLWSSIQSGKHLVVSLLMDRKRKKEWIVNTIGKFVICTTFFAATFVTQ